MTTGLGVDPVVDGSGNPTAGMSSLDQRKISGALYTPGIISGGVVGTTTGMTYTVTAGVAAIQTATGEIVLAPIPSGTVTTTAAGGSARTDIVYVRQNYFANDGNSDTVIGVASGTALPTRALALKKFTVNPGITKTQDAVQTGGIDYSIPYGASLGILHSDRVIGNGTFTSTSTFGTKTIYLPTDRTVRFAITTNLSSSGAVGFDNSKYTEVYFDVMVDSILRFRWNTPGLSQSHGTYHWADVMTLPAGYHTVSYNRTKTGGTPFHHYEVGGLGGTLFWLEDVGPSV
jgi:hypothetical protein